MNVRCASHEGRTASFRCASCARALCEECRSYAHRDEHFCAPCVDAIRRTSPLVVPLFTAGLLAAGVVPLVALVPSGTPVRSAMLVAYGVFAAATLRLGYRKARRVVLDFEPIPHATEAQLREAPPVATYRSPPRRVAERVRELVPPISGSWATLIALSALAFPALVVPALASLPRWLEVELVLALWWAIATLGIGHVLFHGTVAADDADRHEDPGDVSDVSLGPTADFAAAAGEFGGGCAVAIAFAVAIGAALVLAWFLAELVFPALFVGAYATLAMLLRAATRDRHDCRGRVGRSLVWGAIWATIYTAPLAIVVALFHLVLAAR